MLRNETEEEQKEHLEEVKNYCTENNITIDELYEKINRNYDDIDAENYNLPKNMPHFMEFIFYYIYVSPEGKKEFLKRFGHKYFISEKFRIITHGCVIVFMNKEFYRIFPNNESVVYPEGNNRFYRVQTTNYFI